MDTFNPTTTNVTLVAASYIFVLLVGLFYTADPGFLKSTGKCQIRVLPVILLTVSFGLKYSEIDRICCLPYVTVLKNQTPTPSRAGYVLGTTINLRSFTISNLPCALKYPTKNLKSVGKNIENFTAYKQSDIFCLTAVPKSGDGSPSLT